MQHFLGIYGFLALAYGALCALTPALFGGLTAAAVAIASAALAWGLGSVIVRLNRQQKTLDRIAASLAAAAAQPSAAAPPPPQTPPPPRPPETPAETMAREQAEARARVESEPSLRGRLPD